MNIVEISEKLKSKDFQCITLKNGSYYVGETTKDNKGTMMRTGFGIQVNYYKDEFVDKASFDTCYRGNWDNDSMEGKGT